MAGQQPLSQDQQQMERAWAEAAAWAEDCEHCTPTATARPVAGGRTVVEVEHEPGCPNADE